MIDGLIFRWLLDVGPLWPASGTPPGKRELTKQHWADLETTRTALNSLPLDERQKVLRYHFASDAKLCLGSCLLKRKAVANTCGIPWSDVVISQDDNRKPCFKPEGSCEKSLEFNVSHHGSLVALVGCSGRGLQLGVDIVKVDFEEDYRQVKEKGFLDWVSTYEAVFSVREFEDIAHFMNRSALTERESRDTVRAQLRHFYAHWCLKEAFLKMTGEALLAPFLEELEFRNIQAPHPDTQLDSGNELWGQSCSELEVWLDGKQVKDVSLEIQAYGNDYMIATAASTSLLKFPSFKNLHYERDIFPSNVN